MLSFFVDLKHNPAKWQLYALNHTRIRKEWEEPSGMITQTTSKQPTIGATQKEDR
jgi:hypothetical protein